MKNLIRQIININFFFRVKIGWKKNQKKKKMAKMKTSNRVSAEESILLHVSNLKLESSTFSLLPS